MREVVVLARVTPLQVLHHLGDMVTLMVAAPAGIGEVSHVHAEQESGLLLDGCFGWPHVSPFCDEYRKAWVFFVGHVVKDASLLTQSSCQGRCSGCLKKSVG
jgi:hypothetical protein